MNHLIEYMSVDQASQRDKVIQEAQFPSTKPITSYQFSKRAIRGFLVSDDKNLKFFDAAKARLENDIARNEAKRDDSRKDLETINDFIELFKRKRWGKLDIGPSELDVGIMIESVAINVRLDVALHETVSNDIQYAGGIVMFVARSAASRKGLEKRRLQTAQMIHWALEDRNIAPLPRLCWCMDIYEKKVVQASESNSRFRGYVRDACKEIARKWLTIDPPDGYDGPEILPRQR